MPLVSTVELVEKNHAVELCAASRRRSRAGARGKRTAARGESRADEFAARHGGLPTGGIS